MSNRKYWEEKLIEDNEKWLIYDDNWLKYWNNNDKNIDIYFYEHMGFIVIRKDIKCIHFAYVCSNYRGYGILKKMINFVIYKYKFDYLQLYSMNNITDTIWEKLNAKIVKKREKENECSEYIII